MKLEIRAIKSMKIEEIATIENPPSVWLWLTKGRGRNQEQYCMKLLVTEFKKIEMKRR